MTREKYEELFDKLGVDYATCRQGASRRDVLWYNGKKLSMDLNVRRDGFLYFASKATYEDAFDPEYWDAVQPSDMQQRDRRDPEIKGFVPKLFSERRAFADMLSKR